MAATDFANGTVIPTNWLNDVDAVVWDIFGGATTAALARVALGLPSGWPGVINQYLKSDGTDAVWGNMLVAMNGSGYNVEKYHKKIEEIRNEQKETQPEIRYRPTGLRQLELMLT